MHCPKDGFQLEPMKYEEVIMVDRCPHCQGMWLDRGELEKAQETIQYDYSQQLQKIDTIGQAYEQARQQSQRELLCPQCGVAMTAEEYAYCSQIVIDRCSNCGGIWLDAFELRALEIFFEREAGVHQGFFASLLDKWLGRRVD